MKTCNKCGIEKEDGEFYKNIRNKDGLRGDCKLCENESAKKWKNENLEKYNEYNKSWYINNKDYHREYYLERMNDPLKVDMKKNNAKKWYLDNKEYIKSKRKLGRDKENELRRKRTSEDSLYKISKNIRSLIHNAFRNKGLIKSSKTTDILGISFDDFKSYLESKFETWMTWDNYGKLNGELNYGWDIDHIIPISSATSEEEIIKLNHYTNLQPLCSYTNRNIKRNIRD